MCVCVSVHTAKRAVTFDPSDRSIKCWWLFILSNFFWTHPDGHSWRVHIFHHQKMNLCILNLLSSDQTTHIYIGNKYVHHFRVIEGRQEVVLIVVIWWRFEKLLPTPGFKPAIFQPKGSLSYHTFLSGLGPFWLVRLDGKWLPVLREIQQRLLLPLFQRPAIKPRACTSSGVAIHLLHLQALAMEPC